MTNEQILKKVIEITVKKGYDVELGVRGDVVKIFNGKDEAELIISVKEFIFSKDFAKAFFIDSALPDKQGLELENWQYYLQQLILEEKPLQYLKGFLNNN